MIDSIRATSCPRCPQCGGRMVKYKDDVGRRWCKCFRCSVNIPLESGFREGKVSLCQICGEREADYEGLICSQCKAEQDRADAQGGMRRAK